MSKQQKLSEQVESILKNRERRFKHLMRNDRMQDAAAVGEEFYEWFDPETIDTIEYYDEEELVDFYNQLIASRHKKRKGRGK